jgi:ethanolamine utilization protein EutN
MEPAMQLALVQGRATATVKHASLHKQRLLVVLPLGSDRKPSGDPVIAVDQLGAGRNDIVIISSDGLGLRQLLRNDNSPARWWVLGIVD